MKKNEPKIKKKKRKKREEKKKEGKKRGKANSLERRKEMQMLRKSGIFIKICKFVEKRVKKKKL